MNLTLRHCLLASIILSTGCGGDSTLSDTAAKHIADKNVERCFMNKTGVDSKTTFTGQGQFEQGWMFEYEFDGELCAILVGYDGAVELSRTTK